jgi:hypothetical protein
LRCAQRILDAWDARYGDPDALLEIYPCDDYHEYYMSFQPLTPDAVAYPCYSWRPDKRHRPRLVSVGQLALVLWLIECRDGEGFGFADCKKHFRRLHRKQFIEILRALCDLRLIEKVKGHSAKQYRAAIYRLL